MPGTHDNEGSQDDVLDLDALLAMRTLQPTPVKFGGRVYKIRTDLTAQEVQDFLALTRSGHDVEAFTILVGTATERAALSKALRSRQAGDDTAELTVSAKARAINEVINKLPRMHQATASAGLMRASRALAEYAVSDSELESRFNDGRSNSGESKAS